MNGTRTTASWRTGPSFAKRRAGFRLALALSLGVAPVLSSCGHHRDIPVENLRPHVRLTGGPIAGDSINYTTEFYWFGWDEDGVVDHYQYAIDTPGRCRKAGIDSVAPSGLVWRDTTVFRARFRFSATIQDTVVESDGTITLPGKAHDRHCFFVRAVDNEGAVSTADSVRFQAETNTPYTVITTPIIDRRVVAAGRQLNVCWRGEDPDDPDPARRPRYYQWKLITIPSILRFSDPDYAVHQRPGPDFPWNTVGGDTTCARINLNPPSYYLFVVRGVDEAGAREGHFVLGRNAFLIDASRAPHVGFPTLTVRERTLGEFTFPENQAAGDSEVPAGKCVRFEMSADASAYGGIIQGYNYGIDVADETDDGPHSGFRGWSLIRYTDWICFDQPGTHVVTFKVRDTSGGVTYGRVRLRIIDFPLDRGVLYVDDFLMTRDPGISFLTDEFIDARLKQLLLDSGYDVVYEASPWGPGDLSGAVRPLKLSEMASYRLLFWSVLGTGGGLSNGVTSLLKNSSCATGRVLQSYLAAGGSAWIFGENVFAATKDQNGNQGGVCRGTNTYGPDVGIQMSSSDFVCGYLKICPGDFRSAKFNLKTNGIVRVSPTLRAVRERLPVIEVDSTLFAASEGGMGYIDCQFLPNFFPGGGLDTLYTADTARPSGFSRKPIAWRYRDLDPVPRQGPLSIFGFPLFRMKYGSAWGGPEATLPAGTQMLGAVNVMADWFRRHQVRIRQADWPQ